MIEEENKRKGRELRKLIMDGEHEKAIQMIDEIGVNTMIDATSSPMTMAVIHENIPVVTYCLKNGGNPDQLYHPNVKETGQYTLLYLACRSNNVGLVKLLLESEADPNKQNNRGQYPIEGILESGNYNHSGDILKLLLHHGASADSPMSFNDGATFLEVIKEWESDLIQWLD